MRKRKALKGGKYNFSNPALAGPQLKETLYKKNNTDIINLSDTYKKYLNESEKNLQTTLTIKKQAEEELNKEKSREIKEEKIKVEATAKEKVEFRKRASMFIGVCKYVLSSFAYGFVFLAKFIMTNARFLFKMIATAGQGAIIKVIIAIVLIVLIILGATNVIHGFKGPEMPSYTDGGESILSADSEKYLYMPKENNIYTMINNIIPNEYKYKWGSISNSITYMTSGKNIYDNLLKERYTTDDGRSDNIFHITFNDDSDFTTSIIKPKPVQLEFNQNIYDNLDYNKIDKNIISTISEKYPNKCIIPIEPDDKKKYALSIDEIKYYNINDNLIINNSNLIKNIFVKNNTDIKFTTFDNITYSEFDNVTNIISAYSTKLINPNYKGPILRLSTADTVSKQYNKEHKTADFYNKYKSDYLYCIIQDKEIKYADYFKLFINKNDSIYVMGLYDQSGNNHHFTFEDHDNKYMPEYHQNYQEYNNVIKFYSRSILFLTKPISYNKMKLIIKMTIQNDINTVDSKILEKNLNDAIASKDELQKTKDIITANAIKAQNAVYTAKDSDDIDSLNAINNVAQAELTKIEDGGEIYIKLNEAKNKVATATAAKNNYNNNNYVDTYMDFLAKRGSSTVKILVSNEATKKFNIEYNGTKTELIIDNNIIFDIENKNDKIKFESIGNILDSRSDDDKRFDDNGRNLGEMINKHSFKGLLSELRIFKNA